MTTVRRPPSPEETRLAEATRLHLVGWRIPDGVPLSPDTAILPARPDPDLLRTACRTLHTLLVRSCPDTVVLLGRRLDGGERSALIDVGSIQTPLGPLGVDLLRSVRLAAALGDRFELCGGERLADLAAPPPAAGETKRRARPRSAEIPTGIETACVLLQVLAPGCRVIPVLLAEGGEPRPREIGIEVARLFADESVVLAGGTELSREPGRGDEAAARERLRERDAAMIRPLLDLEVDEAVRIANEGGASAPAVLEALLAHAYARGADRGHLIEYARSAGGSGGEWTGRAGIVY